MRLNGLYSNTVGTSNFKKSIIIMTIIIRNGLFSTYSKIFVIHHDQDRNCFMAFDARSWEMNLSKIFEVLFTKFTEMRVLFTLVSRLVNDNFLVYKIKIFHLCQKKSLSTYTRASYALRDVINFLIF